MAKNTDDTILPDETVNNSADNKQVPPPLTPAPAAPNIPNAQTHAGASLELNDGYMDTAEPDVNQLPPEYIPDEPEMLQKPTNKKRVLIICIVIGVLILLVGAGAAYYFLYMKNDKTDKTSSTTETAKADMYVSPDSAVTNTEEVLFEATVPKMPPLKTFVEMIDADNAKEAYPQMKSKEYIRAAIEKQGFKLVDSETTPVEIMDNDIILVYTSKFERKEVRTDEEGNEYDTVSKIVISDQGPRSDATYSIQITFCNDEDVNEFMEAVKAAGFRLNKTIAYQGYDFYCYKGKSDSGDLYIAVKDKSVEISFFEQ